MRLCDGTYAIGFPRREDYFLIYIVQGNSDVILLDPYSTALTEFNEFGIARV